MSEGEGERVALVSAYRSERNCNAFGKTKGEQIMFFPVGFFLLL